MIGIQLPEFTINDIEMFVGKIIVDTIDIFFLFDSIESLKKTREKKRDEHLQVIHHSTERKFVRRNS